MMLQVRLGSYARDMRLLHHALCERPASDRGYIKPRSEIIEVAVSSDKDRITAYLRPSDFYLVGFESQPPGANAQRWFFAPPDGPDAAFAKTGQALRIVGSYKQREGLGIFYQSGAAAGDQGPPRTLGALASSIYTLSRFARQRPEEELKKPLADVCFLIPEALRFDNIFRRMIDVCEGRRDFRYAEFADDVQNWADKSRPGHPEWHKIRTYHRG